MIDVNVGDLAGFDKLDSWPPFKSSPVDFSNAKRKCHFGQKLRKQNGPFPRMEFVFMAMANNDNYACPFIPRSTTSDNGLLTQQSADVTQKTA